MMLNIAGALSARGYTVDLVLVSAEGELLEEVPENVHVTDLAASRVIMSFLPLIQYLKRTSPDALISTITPTNVVAVWALKLASVDTKHIVRVARPESAAAEVQRNTRKERLTARLARRSYPLADEIIAISEGVAQDLAANSSLCRIHVIYNPVVTEQLKALAEEPVDHAWLDSEVPVILGVGRLVDQKDFPTLIRAFAKVRETQEARMLILGDGSDRPQLTDLIEQIGLQDDVNLPGFVANPYKYMSRADVFVNSAKHEGFGNVIVEAMMCETPVVATDCLGAPAEILAGGTYGRLVPVGDPQAMADGIIDSLRDPIDKALLRSRAHDFSVDSAIEQYIDVLES